MRNGVVEDYVHKDEIFAKPALDTNWKISADLVAAEKSAIMFLSRQAYLNGIDVTRRGFD